MYFLVVFGDKDVPMFALETLLTLFQATVSA